MMKMSLFNVQRAITPKVDMPELRFMYSSPYLIVFYICVKFHENSTNGIGVVERTRVHGRNGYVQCSNGNNSISMLSRVTFCTFSHSALHWCEVS